MIAVVVILVVVVVVRVVVVVIIKVAWSFIIFTIILMKIFVLSSSKHCHFRNSQFHSKLQAPQFVHQFAALIEHDGTGGLQGVAQVGAAVGSLNCLWPQQDSGRLRGTATLPSLLQPQAQVTLIVCEGKGLKPGICGCAQTY